MKNKVEKEFKDVEETEKIQASLIKIHTDDSEPEDMNIGDFWI